LKSFLLEVAMKVSKFMTRDVQLVTPTQTIRDAAQMMAELDAGSLPVQQDDRLVGMITDRDIAVRAVAHGKSPDTPVRDVMSREVLYCFDDQEVKDIARNMGEVKVRRLPVVNRDKRLVGIISLGDLALNEESELTASAVTNISKHGGRHSQAAD
jgi:CBS domain-containing protein